MGKIKEWMYLVLRRVLLALLRHTTRPLPGGGQVVVLNTGALIPAEAEAMLHALNSRSIGGILKSLKTFALKGAKKFMETYYVGYGHKSIGDCGSCSIFVERVSMLVTKAIQDWPLYRGQESSTRFLDFATQPFVDSIGTPESSTLLENMRKFYLHGLALLVPDLKLRHPRKQGESETLYDKAIHARAFDIMRGFLPAGATTNFSWHSDLRQIADKLLELRHHPLEEVRTVAEVIENVMIEVFPSSFSRKRYVATEVYQELQMRSYYYTEDAPVDFELAHDGIDRSLLPEYHEVLACRPPKTELPMRLRECGTMRFRYLLDFGSFRDQQRQRSITQRMPLLVMNHGMHPWYLDQLPAHLRGNAEEFLMQHQAVLRQLPGTPEQKQYFIPMGYQVPQRLSGDLRALVYVVELRATRFVHPTLRARAQQMGRVLFERFAEYGLALHFDQTSDRFDIGRGKHDIVRKDQIATA